MSINLEGLSTTTYETEYGRGLLVWKNGLLWSHQLPTTTSGEIENNSVKSRAETGTLVSEKKYNGYMRRITSLLESYFQGRFVRFEAEKVHLDRSHWSQFENDIAEALWKIPYGGLVTYAQLARSAGHSGAHRAVGNFMAKNPFPVMLPCHRVVRADGKPGGYSGGKEWKMKLASIEAGLSPQALIK